MSNGLPKRSITRGICAEVHGLLQKEIWSCWDEVKKRVDSPGDHMAVIHLVKDDGTENLMRIVFVNEKRTFHINTTMAADGGVLIVTYGGKEVMMLMNEAGELLRKTENLQ